MRTFKTFEELIEFVGDQENIETLDNGEITLKDWNKDFTALKKYLKDYGQATSDKKAWESQKEELSQEVTELTAQLNSARDELVGLQTINCGDDKELFQRLNAEIAAIKGRNANLEKQVATIPDLKRKVDEWNSSRIVDAAKKAAANFRVPQNIIDDPDFAKVAVSDLDVDDSGNVFVKGNYLQSEHDYIAAKQRDRPHWMPTPNGDSGDNGKVSDDQATVAGLFSQGESSSKHTRPIRGYAVVSDDIAAIAALFG